MCVARTTGPVAACDILHTELGGGHVGELVCTHRPRVALGVVGLDAAQIVVEHTAAVQHLVLGGVGLVVVAHPVLEGILGVYVRARACDKEEGEKCEHGCIRCLCEGALCGPFTFSIGILVPSLDAL